MFDAPEVQLSELKRENYIALQSVLIKFLEGMLYYYGRTRDDMNDAQVKMIVDDIIDKYYYFRIEDICLCFKKARQDSNYKKFYGKIDGSVIMSWFATYDKERDEIIHMLPQRKEEPVTGGINREEWEEICLAKAAGGDMDAYSACVASEKRKKWECQNRHIYGNYKYNRLHKYDEKR